MIGITQKDHRPLVAFIGAGASKVPPSNLPTWNEFNDLLLESLLERLDTYSRSNQPIKEILSAFKQRRDLTGLFAPDFQAQLMEEEIGADYFRVWQSLDTDVFGPVHLGLAELASRGKLAAIITTNFDRLIETALLKKKQPFRVYHDRTTFEDLPQLCMNEQVALPVIKIHGSIEDTESLVDTLKQRLVGRPEPLMKGLRILLQKYTWLYMGFSGDDFSYDPHYLGILDSASDAKGFVFLTRQGTRVREGARLLAEAYGPDKAIMVEGNLSTWLADTFGLTPPASSTAPVVNDSQERVREGIRRWTVGLGAMAVVNIIYSMLKSSGMEAEAFWLMRRTWKSYRWSEQESPGKSYDRYNYNYGTSLLDAGFISNPVALVEDRSNFLEWKKYADLNAYEFLARSAMSGDLLAARGQLACVLACRGEVGKAIGLMANTTESALARKATLELCDIAIAAVPIYDILRLFAGVVPQLQGCVDIAKQLGDEPRRAILSAHLGRFLTYIGDFEQADHFIEEAGRIGRCLGLQTVILASQAARGRWLTDRAGGKESDEESMRLLQGVVTEIHAMDDVPLFSHFDVLGAEPKPTVVKGRRPGLCRVLLDLNRAALFSGDMQVMEQTLTELDELTLVFLGYRPHFYLAYSQCLLEYPEADSRERAGELIREARRLGELSGNPWVSDEANRLAQYAGEEV